MYFKLFGKADTPMYLYFIYDIASDHCKIGITKNPKRRMQQLQSANAGYLQWIGCVERENARAVETEIHKILYELGAKVASGNQEWFYLDDGILDDAREIAEKYHIGECVIDWVLETYFQGNLVKD